MKINIIIIIIIIIILTIIIVVIITIILTKIENLWMIPVQIIKKNWQGVVAIIIVFTQEMMKIMIKVRLEAGVEVEAMKRENKIKNK